MTPPIALSDWPRLLSLVEQAMDMPVAERETWLLGLDLAAPLKEALRGLLLERQSIQAVDFLAALPALADLAAGSAQDGSSRAR